MMSPKDVRERLPITAAVLAGGRSMRMGVDKTLLVVDGQPLVSRVCDAVGEVCEHVMVVTNRPETLETALSAGVRVLRDEVAYRGPLGGLSTALAGSETEWVLAVAADMPHLEPELVRALWNARDGGDVVVPVTEKGVEPLLALYRAPACLEPAREVLATGRRRLVALFSRVKVVEVPVESLRDVDPELRSFFNVNTPSDLVEARDASSQSSHAERVEPVRCEVLAPRAMPRERPVTVFLNDAEIATMQATPSDLDELAVGFLVAEGLLTDREKLQSVDSDAKRGLVWVTSAEGVPADFAERKRYITSGCGKGVTFASLGHTRGLDPVVSDMTISAPDIYSLVGEMARAATSYRDTGGMHAAALAREGGFRFVREDVGRHNAVDKVLGRAWLDGVPASDSVLLCTGRISYEMAVKAAKARIPLVVSRSAVTDLAAEIAEALSITLVGYARGGRLTVYTHLGRVLTDVRKDDDE